MDQIMRLQTDAELKDAIKTANQLLEETPFRTSTTKTVKNMPTATVEAGSSSPAPVRADGRLNLIYRTAAQFSSTLNDSGWPAQTFLAKQELEQTIETTPAANALLSNYGAIIDLHDDDTYLHRDTLRTNQLGISKGDLQGLMAVTDRDHNALLDYAQQHKFETKSGKAGLYLGGFTASMSAILGFTEAMSARSSLIGAVLGLGAIVIGGMIGYYNRKSELEDLRSKFGNDSSLDTLIINEKNKYR
jgi:hypothetical protein